MCDYQSLLSIHSLLPNADTQCCGHSNRWLPVCYHTGDWRWCQEQCEQSLSMLTYYYLWLCHSCTEPRWCPSLHHTTMRTDICASLGKTFFHSWARLCLESSMILSSLLPSPLHNRYLDVLLNSFYYESHWPLPVCLSMILLWLQSRCSGSSTITAVDQSSFYCLLQTVSSVIP